MAKDPRPIRSQISEQHKHKSAQFQWIGLINYEREFALTPRFSEFDAGQAGLYGVKYRRVKSNLDMINRINRIMKSTTTSKHGVGLRLGRRFGVTDH